MKNIVIGMAVLALLCLGGIAQANITIDTVAVGDIGNAADPLTGRGSVSYDYNIGKYEVTAGQYTAFLNAKASLSDPYGLYNPIWMNSIALGCQIQRTYDMSGFYTYSVAPDMADRPVNMVSFWGACRFANWLSNGQGDGDTETGAYTLTASGIANNTITRNAGWKWAITSDDEWYKAAYYKAGSTNAGYWLYPTQSNTAPANQVLATDPGNSANYYTTRWSIGNPYYRTNVGEFENSASAYGTFDQGGNVWEWNETITSGVARNRRGGAFNEYGSTLKSSTLWVYDAGYAKENIGFRVSQIPEPSSFIAGAALLMPFLALRRRRL